MAFHNRAGGNHTAIVGPEIPPRAEHALKLIATPIAIGLGESGLLWVLCRHALRHEKRPRRALSQWFFW
jgi:hypothetical protein